MTNLQQNSPALSPQTLRRLWFGVPAAALSLLSLLVVAGVLTPMWQALQKDTQRLQELQDLLTQVSLMRQQLRAQSIQEEKALEQKDKLFRLIAGTGDISTMLAVLDRESKASGVRLDLYEPQAAPAAAAPAAANAPAPNGNQAPPPPNPLEMAGLQPQSMLISLHGTYPQLLTFLRRLESLNVLVIQSDLKLEAPPPSTDKTKPPSQEVSMKLSLRLYGKPPEALAQPGAPASAPTAGRPATPPGAAPGQPASSQPAPANTPASRAPAGR